MTRHNRDSAGKFGLLADKLAADAMSLSEAEVRAEMAERHGSVDVAATRVRGLIDAAVAQSGRRKLERARAEVRAARSGGTASLAALSVQDKMAILSRHAANDDGLRQKLTMAARNAEEEISEGDLDSFLEDLLDLGVIDEQGRPL